MSISGAFVHVYCDKCNEEDEIELTALAQRGSYDTRNVPAALARKGFVDKGNGSHWCAECVAEAEESDSE